MRAFITGGAGFIGSHLAEALLEKGHQVLILDNLSTGSIDNIAHLKGRPGFEYNIDSVENEPLLAELIDRSDVVFHFAAAVGVKLTSIEQLEPGAARTVPTAQVPPVIAKSVPGALLRIVICADPLRPFDSVTDAFAVERYSHVMHIVSNVEGLLKDGIGNMDVFRASFPAGTLSGAPKIRAMEIIDQLEPVKRGIYGGACGYLSFGGDMDLAIAIRTGVVMDQVLYVQAAAGIVADSVPELEWKETEAKARALLRAAELVEEGF